jgi:ketosteroid isomerase-like protein
MAGGAMTVLIDPNRTWAKVEERLATETDPVLRRNLATVLEHMRAEAVGDIDGLLETLSDDVRYHAYGTDEPLLNPDGRDGVRAFYDAFIASGATRLQFEIDRLVVDRDCVVTEGVMRMAYPGSTLRARGIDVDDAGAFYLYEARMCTLWPMNDRGFARGEDTYTGGDGFAGIEDRKLTPAQIAELRTG